MIKIISALLIVTIMCTQWGCSAFVPWSQDLSVTSSELDAEIYVNGRFVGTGNIIVRVPRNQNVSVLAKKDGYYPSIRHIGTTISATGVLDIIGGSIILIPFIGLAFPGAQSLNKDNVTLYMEKEADRGNVSKIIFHEEKE